MKLIEQNQIETLKKTIIFSKYFYKLRKTFEMKDRSVVPKTEEKFYLFSELRTKLSYTQNEYWVKEIRSRLSIVLEKYNTFVEENIEEKENDLYIESFKSLILNQLRHIHKEMTFISFTKCNICENFKFVKQNFIEKENFEFSQILNVKKFGIC